MGAHSPYPLVVHIAVGWRGYPVCTVTTPILRQLLTTIRRPILRPAGLAGAYKLLAVIQPFTLAAGWNRTSDTPLSGTLSLLSYCGISRPGITGAVNRRKEEREKNERKVKAFSASSGHRKNGAQNDMREV